MFFAVRRACMFFASQCPFDFDPFSENAKLSLPLARVNSPSQRWLHVHKLHNGDNDFSTRLGSCRWPVHFPWIIKKFSSSAVGTLYCAAGVTLRCRTHAWRRESAQLICSEPLPMENYPFLSAPGVFEDSS